jgi:hypothetical protein
VQKLGDHTRFTAADVRHESRSLFTANILCQTDTVVRKQVAALALYNSFPFRIVFSALEKGHVRTQVNVSLRICIYTLLAVLQSEGGKEK